MNDIRLFQDFEDWLSNLRDFKAKSIILGRLDRASDGNFGNVKNFGGGLWEMKIDYGAGYRLYYMRILYENRANNIFYFDRW